MNIRAGCDVMQAIINGYLNFYTNKDKVEVASHRIPVVVEKIKMQDRYPKDVLGRLLDITA